MTFSHRTSDALWQLWPLCRCGGQVSFSLWQSSRYLSYTAAHSYDPFVSQGCPETWLQLPFPPLSSSQTVGFVVPHRSTTLKPVSWVYFPHKSLLLPAVFGQWDVAVPSQTALHPITVSYVSWTVAGLSYSSCCCKCIPVIVPVSSLSPSLAVEPLHTLHLWLRRWDWQLQCEGSDDFKFVQL